MSAFSLEMIDHQPLDFFNQLTELVRHRKQQLKEAGDVYSPNDPDRETFKQQLQQLIYQRFGFKVDITLYGLQDWKNASVFGVVNAYINTRTMLFADRLIQDSESWYRNQKHPQNIANKIISGKIESPVFQMNRKKAKVQGKFFEKEIVAHLHLSETLLHVWEAEEGAATICHELGHIWTNLEYTNMNVLFNTIIANGIKEILSTKDEKVKFQVITDQKNMWGIEVKEEDLAQLDDKDVITVMTGAAVDKIETEFERSQYHVTNWEALSDQFAARLGAGKYLTKAVGVKYYNNGPVALDSVTKTGLKITSSMAIISGILLASGIGTAVSMIGLVFGLLTTLGGLSSKLTNDKQYLDERNGATYDILKERFKRIYNEVVSGLKKTTLSDEETKAILNDLADIKKQIEDTEEYQPFLIKVVKLFSSDYREQEKKRQLQQLTEELLNNELYVTSAKLKTIKLN